MGDPGSLAAPSVNTIITFGTEDPLPVEVKIDEAAFIAPPIFVFPFGVGVFAILV